jgi:hypothetical protein
MNDPGVEVDRLLELAEEISPKPDKPKLADLPDESEYRQAAAVKRYRERQRRERQRREEADMAAKNRRADPPTPRSRSKPRPRVVHFVASGLTAFGRVWLRGESLEATPEQVAEATDPSGECWLDLDRAAQEGKYGVEYFRHGPAPEDLTPEPDELTARPQVQNDPWTKGIREAWQEEDEAASKSKLVTRSRTISGPRQ